MAVVAKVDKEAKKLQYLHKIYNKKEEPKVEEKKNSKTEEVKVKSVEVIDKRFERKEIIRDIAFIAIVVLIGFSGYFIARFVNF